MGILNTIKSCKLRPEFLGDSLRLYIYIVYAFGLLLVWGTHFSGGATFACFAAAFAITFLLIPPRRALSPLSIFYAYYGVWFVLAPLFATRYREKIFLPEYSLSAALTYTTFGIGVIFILLGTKFGSSLPIVKKPSLTFFAKPERLELWTKYLYITSTLMLVMTVFSSSDLRTWLLAPGDAFLNRSGSGVYVILGHFSSIFLATIVGYQAYTSGRMKPLILFVAWVLLTSPVHGSKLHISLLIIMVSLPWLRSISLFSLQSIALYFSLGGIFLFGLYMRNISWIGITTILPYSLNYFTALDNLAMSVRDFRPGILTTFFLPFVKFRTPFGLSDPKMYYDMNHLLTDIYVPSAWAIRATEQWPVETDLYLNFMFFGGLPLFALYLGFIGFVYGRALKVNSLGHWAAAFLLIVFMVSHLRGSLINHTDFYLYPYIGLILFLLQSCGFSTATDRKNTGAS